MSTQLHDLLATFVESYGLESLKFMAVAIGPGGFTGTRIGVVTARTVAQQLQIPLFGVSSLAAFAWHYLNHQGAEFISLSATEEPAEGPIIAVQMPARRGQIFGAIYTIQSIAAESGRPDGSAIPIPVDVSRGSGLSGGDRPFFSAPPSVRLCVRQCDQVMTQEAWAENLKQLSTLTESLVANGNLGHTTRALLELAYMEHSLGQRSHWSTVQPFYGQSPV